MGHQHHFIHENCVRRLTCITPNIVRSKRALLLWELPTQILNRYLSFLKHLNFEVITETVGKVAEQERRAKKLGYRYDEEYLRSGAYLHQQQVSADDSISTQKHSE
jgi:hypothetical protein